MTFVFTFFIIIRRRAIIECALVLWLISFLSIQDSTGNVQEGYVQSFEDLQQYCRKHNLSHSLLLMQRALTLGSGNYGNVSAEQKQHLEVTDYF